MQGFSRLNNHAPSWFFFMQTEIYTIKKQTKRFLMLVVKVLKYVKYYQEIGRAKK